MDLVMVDLKESQMVAQKVCETVMATEALKDSRMAIVMGILMDFQTATVMEVLKVSQMAIPKDSETGAMILKDFQKVLLMGLQWAIVMGFLMDSQMAIVMEVLKV